MSSRKRPLLFILTKNFKWIIGILAAIILIGAGALIFYSISPSNFPSGQIVTLKKGIYMSQAADVLREQNVVKSPLLFKFFVVLMTGHRQIQAGDYLFDEPESVLRIAYRTAYGIQGLPKIKVTLFEGLTNADMAAVLKKNIPKFDVQTFLALAKPLEGSLFPDTYYFYENSTPQEVVDQLNSTFNDKTKSLLLDIQAFGKPASHIITMASLIEKEATSSADRRIIAGILWKRLSINMPLQVDPPFYYILNKESNALTRNDLATDSPYNLYKHTGLPPTPIDNPGLSAIIDSINPTPSNYLYFLSGRDGKMHYAATFEAHVANKQKYM